VRRLRLSYLTPEPLSRREVAPTHTSTSSSRCHLQKQDRKNPTQRKQADDEIAKLSKIAFSVCIVPQNAPFG
jgi:hypothetical protein